MLFANDEFVSSLRSFQCRACLSIVVVTLILQRCHSASDLGIMCIALTNETQSKSQVFKNFAFSHCVRVQGKAYARDAKWKKLQSTKITSRAAAWTRNMGFRLVVIQSKMTQSMRMAK